MAKEDAATSTKEKTLFTNHAGKPVFFEADAVAAIEGSQKPKVALLHLKSGQTIELQGDATEIAKEFFDA